MKNILLFENWDATSNIKPIYNNDDNDDKSDLVKDIEIFIKNNIKNIVDVELDQLKLTFNDISVNWIRFSIYSHTSYILYDVDGNKNSTKLYISIIEFEQLRDFIKSIINDFNLAHRNIDHLRTHINPIFKAAKQFNI